MSRAFLTALALSLSFACRRTVPKEPLERSPAAARPLAGAPAPAQATPAPPAPAPVPSPDGGAPAAPALAVVEPPPSIKLTIKTVPPKMKVYWGRKLLGETPLILERPRDSGPMDLVFKGEGFLPLHVRAYTYKNDTVLMKATKLADRMTLLGAKQELFSPDGGAPDGGMPLEAPTMLPSPSSAPPPAPLPATPSPR